MIRGAALVLVACASAAAPARGQEVVATVSQGTNMALALSPDRSTLVVDLMGQLWSLPADGGGAQPLLPADEPARNPRFSPDGRRLVYQRLTEGQWDLWLLELESSTRRRLTGPPDNERDPDFSADGRSVVFVSDRSGAGALYRLSLSTGAVDRLTSTGDASWPSVSERDEIAYVERRGTEWALRILPADGAPLTVVTGERPMRAPSWRPGGGVLVYTEQQDGRRSELRMAVLSDEPVVKALTEAEDVFGFRPAWRSPAELVYSADGRVWRRTLGGTVRRPVPLFAGIAVQRPPRGLDDGAVAPRAGPHAAQGVRGFRAAPSGGGGAFTALGDLWLGDGHGRLRRLTDDAHVDIDPAFTPDGERLVFASDRAGTMDLWSIEIESGRLRRLTSGPGKSYGPAVAPDGRRVAYLATTGFGPWAPSELRVLTLAAPGDTRTLAGGLRDAGDVVWEPDGDTLSVRARDPGAGGAGSRRARYEIGLSRTTRRWSTEPPPPPATPPPNDAAGGLTWRPPEPGGRYVIEIGRLFDGVGTEYRHHMDIHVEGRRIAAVSARGLGPDSDAVIDARGYTAIPGLIDLHAHGSSLAGERLGRAWLAYGVTTVREVGSVPGDGLERREAWASGRRLGPRLLLSARLDGTRGWTAPSDSAARPVYDVAEIYRGQPPALRRNVLRDAGRFGLPVFSEDLFPTVRFGINGLEHVGGRPADPYDLERSTLNRSYGDVRELLTGSGIAVTPTLVAFGGYPRLAAERRGVWADDAALGRLFTAEERSAWRSPRGGGDLGGLEGTVAALVRAGVRITAGSDAPSVPYGLGLHAELALLSRAGVPNDQALRLATSEPALALGLERAVGTIEPGKLADLVILDGNPLVDITDTLRIVAGGGDGVWHDRDDLLGPR